MDILRYFRSLWLGSPTVPAEPADAVSPPGPADLAVEAVLDLPEIHTFVPNANPIALRAYYPHMRQYYVACEPQTKRWCVRTIGRNWRIFDVGANIGYYSALFGRLAPEGRVAAYEPTETARMTARNLALNGVGNVELHEVALGNETSEVGYRIWGEAPEQRRYRFSTVDLEMRRLGWDRLDLLKIDVDSFDFDVLKGAVGTLDRYDPWVLVKLNHALAKRGHSVGEVLDWLAAQGYAEAILLDDENFLLRRGGVARRAARGGLTLRFACEPVYMVPDWSVTDHIAAELAGPSKPGPSGRIDRDDDSERVTIDGPVWSYGAILPMRPAGQGSAIVRLDLTVEGADVGVICVGAGLSKQLGREVFVPPGLTTRVEIWLDRVEDCAAVVLRKAPGSDRTAVVRFGTPDVRLARAEANSRPGISLDPDAGSVALSEIALGLADDLRGELPARLPDDRLVLVGAEALGDRLGHDYAARPPRHVIDVPLGLFRMESHDAHILSQIFRMHAPQRHLEFGTWQGFGAALCARNCEARIWTVNLPAGENCADGRPAYADAGGASDAGARIGHLYRAAGYADRITQLLCDSRALDVAAFGPGFFDSVLIDGGHSREVVTSDTDKALDLVRPGGLILWHDFCPDAAVLAGQEAAQGVVAAVLANWSRWRPCFDDLFWIRPSWILLGLRNERRIAR